MAKTISITLPAARDLKFKNWVFSEPKKFEETISRTVMGGAIAGFAAAIISLGFGSLKFQNFVSLVFLTSAFATAFQTKSWRKSILAGGLGFFAAWVYDLYDDQWPWFAAALSGLILAPVFSKASGWKRTLGTGLITGLAIFAGFYTTNIMQSQAVLAGLVPNILAQVAYGGILGLFMGLGASALHFQKKPTALHSDFKKAIEKTKNSELSKLLERTSSLYQLIKSEFQEMNSPAHPDIEVQVEALGKRILKLGAQCTGLQEDLQRANVDNLSQRIEELRQKSEATKDSAAKHTLKEAIDNLEEQRLALAAIETSLDRVLARIHADAALLERLRFALLQLRNTHQQNTEEHGFELNISLEAISQEIEATCLVVDEVYLEPLSDGQEAEVKTNLVNDAVSPETMLFRKTA